MKRAEIVRKFDEIVAFAEIEKFMDAPVKHYSSGMYVRLAFAVAAHPSTGSGRRPEPEILLIDEVLVVGDATTSSHCDTLTRTGKLS
jgi:lipopolysaccharide transport system ATP-binding protein